MGEWTPERNIMLMRRIDLDEDGQIQVKEFLRYFNQQWYGGLDLFSDTEFQSAIEMFKVLLVPCHTLTVSATESRIDDHTT